MLNKKEPLICPHVPSFGDVYMCGYPVASASSYVQIRRMVQCSNAAIHFYDVTITRRKGR